MKQCRKCCATKPLEQFPKEKLGKDGLRAWCKTCMAAKIARWRAKNPERLRQHQHQGYLNHREQRIADVLAWRQAHPELAKEYDQRSHRRQRQDPVKSQRMREATRRWERAHPEKGKQRRATRLAHERNAPVIEKVDPKIVYARDKGICTLCHKAVKRKDASMDHIVPISKGGEHSYRNIALAHFICNVRKNNRNTTQQMRLF